MSGRVRECGCGFTHTCVYSYSKTGHSGLHPGIMVRKHSLTKPCNWFRALRINAGAQVSTLSASTRATTLTTTSPSARPERLSSVSSAVVASASCVLDVRHSSYGCARTHA